MYTFLTETTDGLRGVKEAIYVLMEKPSVNGGCGLRHQLSVTYNDLWTNRQLDLVWITRFNITLDL